MEEICCNINPIFAKSMELVSCCDYYEDGFVFIRTGRFGADYNTHNQIIKRFDDDISLFNHFNSNNTHETSGAHDNNDIDDKNLINFIHDMTIQINYLHKHGLTLTDVDVSDIIFINGHYCIKNTYNLITFDKKTGYGDLNFPITFGKYKAPELSNIDNIPAINMIHKNSVVWSIGMIVFNALFDDDDDSSCSSSYYSGSSDSSYYSDSSYSNDDNYISGLSNSDDDLFFNFVKRCLWFNPSKRVMMIV